MGLRINTNVLSITAQRNLSQTAKAFGRALERLASGSRINQAGDDPAGLAIGEGLKSQITALSRGVRNINDAMGILSTADGALGIQVDIAQRMRELALQSANGTLAEKDRSHLETEFQQLVEEFNRVATATDFNGNRLLNGSFQAMAVQVGANKGETIGLSLEGSTLEDIFEQSTTSSVSTNSGSFEAESLIDLPNNFLTSDIDFADFNGDGNLDILWTKEFSSEAQLGFGDGAGGVSSQSSIPLNAVPNNDLAVAVGDINNDGEADLVAADWGTGNLAFTLGNGNGTFAFLSTRISSSQETASAELGDFNNDGNLDIVIVSSWSTYEIQVYLGNGDGSFEGEEVYATGAIPREVYVEDLNADGFDDVVIGSLGGETDIFLANSDGTFALSQNFDVGGADLNRATLADFDGDSDLDLAVTSSQAGELYIYSNNGDGSFAFSQTLVTGADSERLDAGDVDGDGDEDLVIASATDQFVQIVLNDGDGTFSLGSTLAGSDDVETARLVDLDGDGALDIVTAVGEEGGIYLGGVQTVTVEGGSTDVADLTISTQTDAQDVLEILDAGIQGLLQRRASIGAQQNRLDSAANNSTIMVENLAQAKSQILDTDIAAETAELTRAQILQQAGISVLGQANTSMQIVLELLRF